MSDKPIKSPFAAEMNKVLTAPPKKDRPNYNKLKPKHKLVVQEVASGTDPKHAVAKFYRGSRPEETARKIFRNETVQNALNEVIDAAYPNMAEKVATYLANTLDNDMASDQVKLKVIDTIIKVRGWEAPKRTQNLNAKLDFNKLPGGKK